MMTFVTGETNTTSTTPYLEPPQRDGQIKILVSEQIIKDTVKVKLTQSQFDALVSYVYNSGGQPGQWYRDKEIPELLNSGKYYEAAMIIDSGPYTGKNIGYAPGLEKRRQEESALFLFGT